MHFYEFPVAKHTYPGELQEAAQAYLKRLFDGGTMKEDTQPCLVDAAMLIVNGAAYIQPKYEAFEPEATPEGGDDE